MGGMINDYADKTVVMCPEMKYLGYSSKRKETTFIIKDQQTLVPAPQLADSSKRFASATRSSSTAV